MSRVRKVIIDKAKKHHFLLKLIRKIRFVRNRMRSLFYSFSRINENLIIF